MEQNKGLVRREQRARFLGEPKHGFVMTGKANSGKVYHNTIERRFLFDDNVASYIGEVYQRALEANRTTLNLDSRISLKVIDRN